MRIYVLDSTYPDNEDHAEEYLAKLEYDARKVDGFQRLRLVDLHGGISIPGFALEYVWLAFGGLALFLAGKPIRDNLEAWTSLVKKVAETLRYLRSKGHKTVVDFETACAIALAQILASSVSSIELLQHTRISPASGEIYCQILLPRTDDISSLIEQDDHAVGYISEASCNLFAFKVEQQKVLVVGVRKNGSTEFAADLSPFDPD